MDFKYPNSKKLYLVVEISQLLSKYNCTFSEAENILSLSLSEIQQQRENLEYDTTLDYINGNKAKNVDNEEIKPSQHIEPYYLKLTSTFITLISLTQVPCSEDTEQAYLPCF